MNSNLISHDLAPTLVCNNRLYKFVDKHKALALVSGKTPLKAKNSTLKSQTNKNNRRIATQKFLTNLLHIYSRHVIYTYNVS